MIKTQFDQFDSETKNIPNRKPLAQLIDIFFEFLPKIFEDKKSPTPIYNITLDLFVLPTEQTQEEKD